MCVRHGATLTAGILALPHWLALTAAIRVINPSKQQSALPRRRATGPHLTVIFQCDNSPSNHRSTQPSWLEPFPSHTIQSPWEMREPFSPGSESHTGNVHEGAHHRNDLTSITHVLSFQGRGASTQWMTACLSTPLRG